MKLTTGRGEAQIFVISYELPLYFIRISFCGRVDFGGVLAADEGVICAGFLLEGLRVAEGWGAVWGFELTEKNANNNIKLNAERQGR